MKTLKDVQHFKRSQMLLINALVLLSAHAELFSVSCMRDFFFTVWSFCHVWVLLVLFRYTDVQSARYIKTLTGNGGFMHGEQYILHYILYTLYFTLYYVY